jgi:hypothetical protein
VKGYDGCTHEQDPNPDLVVKLTLADAKLYEEDPDWKRLEPEIRQVKDIDITTLTTNYEAQRFIHNPTTGLVVTAPFPPDVKAPFSLGVNVQSKVVHDMVRLYAPLREGGGGHELLRRPRH